MVEAKNAHRPRLPHGLLRRKQILWASSEGGDVLRALIRLQPPAAKLGIPHCTPPERKFTSDGTAAKGIVPSKEVDYGSGEKGTSTLTVETVRRL